MKVAPGWRPLSMVNDSQVLCIGHKIWMLVYLVVSFESVGSASIDPQGKPF